MNYPVWDVPAWGSGLVVAVIAILHVLVSHLAIGGGAFLFVAELWSNRQPDGARVRDWLHKYATYFLVYTTVFGAITGVGIWFAIQLANPEATSLLIHQFVFAWAIEWVMFLGELTVLYFYYYGWQTNPRRLQVFLAGAYFGIAWGSLFVINGILSFMLTPGEWTLQNGSIAAGFFNPGFVPSLLIRTLVMLSLGGLFGVIVGARIADDDGFKERVISFSVKWVIPAAVLVPLLTWWYWSTLPENARVLAQGGVAGVGGGKMEVITRHLWLTVAASAAILVGALLVAARPRATRTVGALALFLVAQCGVMGAEFFREMARKPYVIHNVLYSNSLWAAQAADAAYMQGSYLDQAKWATPLEPQSRARGEWVFRLQCVNCHTRDGYRAIMPRTKDWTEEFGQQWLTRMSEGGVMPPFQGDEADRAALARYLVSLHHEAGRGEETPAVTSPPTTAPVAKEEGR
ncbi:MAG: c-type cytochrome [Planctomycetes bacterium]|nr:c-type cytochrome [Planctomycetota bacterium]